MRTSHRPLIVLILAALFTGAAARGAEAPVKVEAEGKAAGDAVNCREQALTDALREAVRKGAGVNVVEQTQVRDFVLDYDRVFAASFGYVRDYTVLKAGLSSDGIYRVTVRAEVGAGEPSLKDALTLRQLVHLKQSPRVAIEVDESIAGVAAGSELARGWLEQTARELQLQLVDVRRAARQNDRLAAKDAADGDAAGAARRKASVTQDADFIIEARIRGSCAGQDTLYGAAVQRVSVGVDLKALKPDTGEVVAAVALPAALVDSLQPTPTEAARDAVHRTLGGEAGAGKGSGGAWLLFRRIMSAWASDLDLGTVMRLELAQLSDAQHEALLKRLRQVEQITAVWPREFDAKGLTVVDVESRLDVAGLKTEVIQGLGGTYAFTGGTRHHLQFSLVPAAAAAASAAPPGNRLPVGIGMDRMSLSGWLLSMVGVASVCWGASRLRHRSGRSSEAKPELHETEDGDTDERHT